MTVSVPSFASHLFLFRYCYIQLIFIDRVKSVSTIDGTSKNTSAMQLSSPAATPTATAAKPTSTKTMAHVITSSKAVLQC